VGKIRFRRVRAANAGRLFLAVLAIAAFAYVQAAGEDNAFMPKGGRALLLDMLGASPAGSDASRENAVYYGVKGDRARATATDQAVREIQ